MESLQAFNTLTPEQKKRARTAPVMVFGKEFFGYAARYSLFVVIVDATHIFQSVFADSLARAIYVLALSTVSTTMKWLAWSVEERSTAKSVRR